MLHIRFESAILVFSIRREAAETADDGLLQVRAGGAAVAAQNAAAEGSVQGLEPEVERTASPKEAGLGCNSSGVSVMITSLGHFFQILHKN
jgi:hypothetical protein